MSTSWLEDMSILPRLRLAPRIVIAIFIAVAAAYLLNQMLRVAIPPPPFLVVERGWLVDAIASGARLASDVPIAESETKLAQLPQSNVLDFTVSDAPPAGARAPMSELAKGLRTSIAERLGNSVQWIGISSKPYDQNYTEHTVRSVLVIIPHLPAMLTARTLASRESFVLGQFTLTMHLRNGRWLTVTQRDFTDPGRHYARIGFYLAANLLIIVLFAAWMTRSIVTPLTRLANAAERLGRSGETTFIEGMKLPEYVAIADTFNTMQLRLTRFIDERVNMLAAISHDLRTPLTRLRLLAEYLDDREQRGQLLSNIDEMEAMVSDALAFMRAEVRRESIEQVDIAALLISLADDFSDMGEVVTYTGPDHADLPGRPLALKRAFSNLITNGTKYGGAAHLSLTRTSDSVVIDVRDDGPGIPEAQTEQAFAPFVRLETSRSRETGGSGLGLAGARDIVRSHGGEIRFVRPRDGFVVRVSFPVPA